MRYIITENQYKVLLKEDRVQYLKTQNVISPDDIEKYQKNIINKRDISNIPTGDIEPKNIGGKGKDIKLTAIQGEGGVDIAYFVEKGGKTQIKLTDTTFSLFVEADPSSNKQYVQWLIEVFKKYALHDIEESKRFVTEDLPQATEALEQFDCVKNSKKFRLNAKNRQGAPNNPKDIKQYNSIGQLYNVVSAFVCGEEDGDESDNTSTGNLSRKGYKLFTDLMTYSKLGSAKLHKLSDRILIYQPLTLQASCEPLGSLSNWCTRATPTGGIEQETGREHFHSYRGDTGNQSYKRPTGEASDYYVIMPIELFQAENPSQMEDIPWQFHFESGQYRDKGNRQISDSKLSSYFLTYPELGRHIKEELIKWSKELIKRGGGLMENIYNDQLNRIFNIKVGDYVDKNDYEMGVENIKKLASEQDGELQHNKYLKWLMENLTGLNVVDYLDPEKTENLDFSNMKIGEIPDLSSFKKLSHLIATNCGLTKLPPIEYLPTDAPLSTISCNNNNITEAPPNGYEKLTNLYTIVIDNNPIEKINVDVLNKMVDGGMFMRFKISDSSATLDNLTPENRKEYTEFVENNSDGGYFI